MKKKKNKHELEGVLFSVRMVFLFVGLFFIITGIGMMRKETDVSYFIMGLIMLIIGSQFLIFLCVELYRWFKHEKKVRKNE